MTRPIELTDIEKSYPVGFTKQKILHGISLQIQTGEVFGFIGPNGAGKSTLINLLMGFTRPDRGTLQIHGKPPLVPSTRRHIGYLPEGPRLYENLNASELLRFGCTAAGLPSDGVETRIDGLLDRLEISQAGSKPIHTYSKGMKQRLGLAMAMIHDPDTLILDEPMSGLDPIGRNLLKRIILDLKAQGKTIFFSSHILNDVEVLCDRIGVINKGRLLYTGSVEAFKGDDADIEDAFMRMVQHQN
jgi:ABC-2 type transport system ATP-binding protein